MQKQQKAGEVIAVVIVRSGEPGYSFECLHGEGEEAFIERVLAALESALVTD